MEVWAVRSWFSASATFSSTCESSVSYAGCRVALLMTEQPNHAQIRKGHKTSARGERHTALPGMVSCIKSLPPVAPTKRIPRQTPTALRPLARPLPYANGAPVLQPRVAVARPLPLDHVPRNDSTPTGLRPKRLSRLRPGRNRFAARPLCQPFPGSASLNSVNPGLEFVSPFGYRGPSSNLSPNSV